MDIKKINLLIAVTGSVATIKLPVLIKSLIEVSATSPKVNFEVSFTSFYFRKWHLI